MVIAQCCMITKTFIISDKPLDFNVTHYRKFFDKISDTILQLFCKNFYLLDFAMLSKENTHNYMQRLLNIPPLFNCIIV